MTDLCRLIGATTSTGADNMAVDEALLQLVAEGRSPPTLRFYLWNYPWVSLGSGQSAADLDLGAIRDRGWGLVRRSSGGTAVLHQGQLGYSLILPTNHPIWRGDLIASYERLSVPFQTAFARLGVETTAAPPGSNAAFVDGAPALASRICFAALGPYELTRRGRKLLGNSQIRRRQSSAQHGVIQVEDSQDALVDLLPAVLGDERDRLLRFLRTHVTSLQEEAGHCLATNRVTSALVESLQRHLDVRFEPGKLSELEKHTADEIGHTKYRSDEWSLRR